jgi:hypothetical protein
MVQRWDAEDNDFSKDMVCPYSKEENKMDKD